MTRWKEILKKNIHKNIANEFATQYLSGEISEPWYSVSTETYWKQKANNSALRIAFQINRHEKAAILKNELITLLEDVENNFNNPYRMLICKQGEIDWEDEGQETLSQIFN